MRRCCLRARKSRLHESAREFERLRGMYIWRLDEVHINPVHVYSGGSDHSNDDERDLALTC